MNKQHDQVAHRAIVAISTNVTRLVTGATHSIRIAALFSNPPKNRQQS